MPKTEAKARADAKYHKKAYDQLKISIRKDAVLNRAAIQEHAQKMGESMAAFILRAVKETIKRDSEN